MSIRLPSQIHLLIYHTIVKTIITIVIVFLLTLAVNDVGCLDFNVISSYTQHSTSKSQDQNGEQPKVTSYRDCGFCKCPRKNVKRSGHNNFIAILTPSSRKFANLRTRHSSSLKFQMPLYSLCTQGSTH